MCYYTSVDMRVPVYFARQSVQRGVAWECYVWSSFMITALMGDVRVGAIVDYLCHGLVQPSGRQVQVSHGAWQLCRGVRKQNSGVIAELCIMS